MPFKRLSLLVGLCAVALVLPSAAGAEGTPIPGQYIVVLKVGATGRGVAADHARSDGAKVIHTYDAAIHGYAARLSASDIGANSRASRPPMNPKTIPFEASRGESSKVVLAGPSYETVLPFSPASRQNGSS